MADDNSSRGKAGWGDNSMRWEGIIVPACAGMLDVVREAIPQAEQQQVVAGSEAAARQECPSKAQTSAELAAFWPAAA